MAADSADLQLKAVWTGMAGAWLKLADLAEKNTRADLVCETPAQPPSESLSRSNAPSTRN
jgi:hypothetical protein